jgi:hypothetical protein
MGHPEYWWVCRELDGLRLRAPAFGQDLFERAERGGRRPLVALHEAVGAGVAIGPGVAAVGEDGDFLAAEAVEVRANVGSVAREVRIIELAILGKPDGRPMMPTSMLALRARLRASRRTASDC